MYYSKCCNAKVKSEMCPDFIGDNPKEMKIGTCYFICEKCGFDCDVKKYKSVKEIKKNLHKRTLLDEIIYYGFYIWWNIIIDLKWKVPNLIHRTYYGWGKADTWNFDYYLAKIISEGIIYLKKDKSGIPCDLAKKYDDKTAIIKRNERLNKIIHAFKLHIIWIDGRVLTKKEQKEYQEGLKLFIKYMGDLWS